MMERMADLERAVSTDEHMVVPDKKAVIPRRSRQVGQMAVNDGSGEPNHSFIDAGGTNKIKSLGEDAALKNCRFHQSVTARMAISD